MKRIQAEISKYTLPVRKSKSKKRQFIFEIKDLDGSKVESENHNEFEYLTILPSKIDADIKLKERTLDEIVLTKTGSYDIYAKSNEECAFTVKIDFEEVDA